jgi:hypothetical protein
VLERFNISFQPGNTCENERKKYIERVNHWGGSCPILPQSSRMSSTLKTSIMILSKMGMMGTYDLTEHSFSIKKQDARDSMS